MREPDHTLLMSQCRTCEHPYRDHSGEDTCCRLCECDEFRFARGNRGLVCQRCHNMPAVRVARTFLGERALCEGCVELEPVSDPLERHRLANEARRRARGLSISPDVAF